MCCYWYPIPTGYLINVEWPIDNDAEDKRGCQCVQIIIGKPVNGHLRGGGGGAQTRPIANSAPNPLGPYCQNLGELYQRHYTCIYLSVAEGVLKNLQALKCEV